MTAGFAAVLRDDATAYGTWIKLPVVASVELAAAAGFDFVTIDMEHAPLDLPTVHQLIGAARGCGLGTLVRVPDRSASTIGRVLDSGADGVLVPHTDDAAQAAAVVAAGRFPPHGTRGFGPTTRAGGWGSDVAGYRDSGEHVLIAPQIESPEAVADVETIAQVPGIGALFVGPADLAVATGLDPSSPAFAEILDRIHEAAVTYGVPLGTAVGSASAAHALTHHHQFVLVGNDATMLGDAARRTARELREAGPFPTPTGAAGTDRP